MASCKEEIETEMRKLFKTKRQKFLEDIPTVECVNTFPGGFSDFKRQLILAQQREKGSIYANNELLDAIMQKDFFWKKYLQFSRKTGHCQKTAALVQEVLDANLPQNKISNGSQTQASILSNNVGRFQHPMTHVEQSKKVQTFAKVKECVKGATYVHSNHAEVMHPTEEEEDKSSTRLSSKSVLRNPTSSCDENPKERHDSCSNIKISNESPENCKTRKDDNDDNKDLDQMRVVKPVGQKRLTPVIDLNDEDEDYSESFILSETEVKEAYEESYADQLCEPEIDSLKCEPKNYAREVSVGNGTSPRETESLQQSEQSSDVKPLNYDHAKDKQDGSSSNQEESSKILNKSIVRPFPDNLQHFDGVEANENNRISGACAISDIDQLSADVVAGHSQNGNKVHPSNSTYYDNCVFLSAHNVQMDTKHCNIKDNHNTKKTLQDRRTHENESLIPQNDLNAVNVERTNNKRERFHSQTMTGDHSELIAHNNISQPNGESENEGQGNQIVHPCPDRPSSDVESSFDTNCTVMSSSDDLRDSGRLPQEEHNPVNEENRGSFTNTLQRSLSFFLPDWLQFELGFILSFKDL